MNVFCVSFDDKYQVVECQTTLFGHFPNLHWVDSVKHTEIHTAQPLVAELWFCGVEIINMHLSVAKIKTGTEGRDIMSQYDRQY